MRVIELRNQHMQAEKKQIQVPGENGSGPESKEIYRLIFTDRGTGDVHFLTFDEQTRDMLVSQLTSGIIVSGPTIPPL